MAPAKLNYLLPKASKAFAGLTLMVFYLVGLAKYEDFHEQFHAPTPAELHSIISESDPCHRSLFHNDQANGCHHRTHLEESDSCSVCGIALHTEMVACAADLYQHGTTFITQDSALRVFNSNYFHGIDSSRAPPVA